MENQLRLSRLLDLFRRLRAILVSEGDENWIRGIDMIIDALLSHTSSGGVADALRYAEHTYKSMLGGNGSFSDFFIWREDFEERVRENKNLDDLKSDIWDAFE